MRTDAIDTYPQPLTDGHGPVFVCWSLALLPGSARDPAYTTTTQQLHNNYTTTYTTTYITTHLSLGLCEFTPYEA